MQGIINSFEMFIMRRRLLKGEIIEGIEPVMI